jgi:hypothetical protein
LGESFLVLLAKFSLFFEACVVIVIVAIVKVEWIVASPERGIGLGRMGGKKRGGGRLMEW